MWFLRIAESYLMWFLGSQRSYLMWFLRIAEELCNVVPANPRGAAI